MQSRNEVPLETGTLYSSIAEKLVGGVLECATCHRCTSPAASELAQYLESGWPRCCGLMMSFSLQKEKRGA